MPNAGPLQLNEQSRRLSDQILRRSLLDLAMARRKMDRLSPNVSHGLCLEIPISRIKRSSEVRSYPRRQNTLAATSRAISFGRGMSGGYWIGAQTRFVGAPRLDRR